MARWRSTPRIELPSLLRVFRPDEWAEPDELESRMGELPDDWRLWHARRRWNAARLAYFKVNPDAGAQELDDLLARIGARRRLAR